MIVCFVYLKGPLFHDALGSHTFFITNKKPYTFELQSWNRTYYAWTTCKLCWHKNLSIGDWQNNAHSGMATIVCEFGAENCADHVVWLPLNNFHGCQQFICCLSQSRRHVGTKRKTVAFKLALWVPFVNRFPIRVDIFASQSWMDCKLSRQETANSAGAVGA